MTDRIETLTSLQQRIREATGPDRELDCEIARVLLDWTFEKMKGDARPYWRSPEQKNYYERSEPSRYTSDPDGLGACVSLLNERFPGVKWERTVDGRFALRGVRDAPSWSYDAEPLVNDCLTFIDAIITASIAQEEARERTASEEDL